MKLITRQSLANETHARWMAQYPKDKEGIGAKLLALGENPNPDEVDATIGNGSWTRTPECDECGSNNVPVVQVGEESDYNSNTANLCKECLAKALDCAI